MPFPPSKRAIYSKNPLRQVICQVRFPPILSIEAKIPADYQEAIRAEYPLYSEQVPDTALSWAGQVPPEVSELVRRIAAPARQVVHQFASADNVWEVTLGRDSLTMLTSKYENWTDFSEHLAGPLGSLQAIYKPLSFTRLGLRYINVIRRTEIGLDADTSWGTLLNASIAGELGTNEIATSIVTADRQTLLTLNDHDGQVRIRHGLAVADDDQEQCFLIDADFFLEGKTEKENVHDRLARFNQKSGRLFRWCLQPALIAALARGNS